VCAAFANRGSLFRLPDVIEAAQETELPVGFKLQGSIGAKSHRRRIAQYRGDGTGHGCAQTSQVGRIGGREA
jgi:hypothetical protein